MAFPPNPFRPLALALAALALAACGAQPSSSADPAGAATADMVHQRWVEAVRDGDSAAAAALADPALPDPAAFARDAVDRMRDYRTSPASPTGPLQQVETRPVAGDEGLSVWRFAAKRWCYRTTLTSRGGRWTVSRWGQTSACP